MNMLTRWIKDAQEINVAEKGVSYSEEAFTQLYEEALKLEADHKIELRFATGRGAIIGAAGVGLVALGIKGFNKMRDNKSKKVKVKVKDVEALLNGDDENLSPEVVDKIKNGRVKKMSKKDKEELTNIIDEIKSNENGKVH